MEYVAVHYKGMTIGAFALCVLGAFYLCVRKHTKIDEPDADSDDEEEAGGAAFCADAGAIPEPLRASLVNDALETDDVSVVRLHKKGDVEDNGLELVKAPHGGGDALFF